MSACNLSQVGVIVKDFSAHLQILPRLRQNTPRNPFPVQSRFQEHPHQWNGRHKSQFLDLSARKDSLQQIKKNHRYQHSCEYWNVVVPLKRVTALVLDLGVLDFADTCPPLTRGDAHTIHRCGGDHRPEKCGCANPNCAACRRRAAAAVHRPACSCQTQ